jgi:hypothetical protein
MTLAAVAPTIEYLENGVSVTFAVPFQFRDSGDIEVTRISALGVETAAVLGVDYSVTGGAGATGSVTTTAAMAAGWTLRIRRVTPRSQDANYAAGDAFPAETHEGALDRAMAVAQEQDVELGRALLVPRGTTAPAMGAATDYAGAALGMAADGSAIVPLALDGLGGVSALGSLALSTGGLLVGTSYGTAQAVLDQLFAQNALNHRAFPPMPDGKNYADVWPTSTNPMAAARDTNTKSLLIRVLRTSGGVNIVNEWILRDPDGTSGINGGYQIWHERAFVVNGRMIPWHTQADPSAGPITTSEFEIIAGPMAQPYDSAGPGPDWRQAGFGHGNMLNTRAANQITLNGVGANLQNIANWPAGGRINGQVLNIACTFTIVAGAGSASALQIVFTQTFGVHTSLGNQGMIENGVMTALLAGYGYNDTYTLMSAAQRIYADRAKLAGDPLEIPLVGDNGQKGNWNTQDLTTVVFYSSLDRRFTKEAVAVLGPPTRINGSSTPHWARNSFARTHMQDSPDNSKFRMFGASSIAPAVGRTAWALPLGDTVEWLTYRRTEYRAGGPL